MADIVQRLNEHAEQAHEAGSLGWRDTMNEAADEITRLKAEVERKDAALMQADQTFEENGLLAVHAARQQIRAALNPSQEPRT
jgi:hypothetical protein